MEWVTGESMSEKYECDWCGAQVVGEDAHRDGWVKMSVAIPESMEDPLDEGDGEDAARGLMRAAMARAFCAHTVKSLDACKACYENKIKPILPVVEA